MNTVVMIAVLLVVFYASYFIGIFGFSQIIGSIQHRKERNPAMTAYTCIVWIVILVAVCLAVHKFIPQYKIAYYVGTVISFIRIWLAGEIY